MSKVMDAREEFYFHQTSLPPGSQPPTFDNLPGTGHRIVEGSDARFECRIRGNPPPKVTWTRRGLPVTSDHRRTATYDPTTGHCSLTIRNLTIDDDGEYKCSAVNVAGEASLTIDIQRNDPNAMRQMIPSSGQYQQPKTREEVIERKKVIQSQAVERCYSSEGYYGVSEPTGLLSPGQMSAPFGPVNPLSGSSISGQSTVIRSEKLEAFAECSSSVQEYAMPSNRTSTISSIPSMTSRVDDQSMTKTWTEKQRYHHQEEQMYVQGQPYTRQPMPTPRPVQPMVQPRAQPPPPPPPKQPEVDSRAERVIQEQQRILDEQKRILETQRIQEVRRLQEEQRLRSYQASQFVQQVPNPKPVPFTPQQPIVQERKMASVEKAQQFKQESFYDEPEVTFQPQAKVQKVSASSSVVKREVTAKYKQFSLEDKENQESIYLRHLGPFDQLEPDPRPSEIVQLRHIVPSVPTPAKEPEDGPFGPPKFTKVCPDLTILEGNVARFDCRYEPSADPTIIIEWFHDGRPLITGSRFNTFSGSGHVFLNMMETIREDSGTYSCRATNKFGSDEVKIVLNVIDKSDLKLDDLDMDEAKMDKFQILEDATRFRRETHVEEETWVRPRFLTQFKSLVLPETETAHFECKIEPQDDPNLKIEWFVNGHELPVGSRWQHFQDFGFISLNINHVVSEDSGSYVCRITNLVGYAEQSVTLKVMAESTLRMETINPDSLDQISYLESEKRSKKTDFEGDQMAPRFLTKFRDQRIYERSGGHFEARIEPVDDPDLKIEWFFEGQELQVGSRWQHFQDFGYICLNILQAIIADSGTYTCRISNRVGYDECSVRLEVISTTETIDENVVDKFQYLEDSTRFRRETEIEEEVRMAPRFVTPLKDLTIQEGQVAHYECRIEPTTDPDLKVEWFFGEKELQVGSRYQPFSYFGFIGLNILQTTIDDSGTYTCRISNKVGHDECSVRLEVISATEIVDRNVVEKFQYLEDSSRFRRETEIEEEAKMAPRFLTPLKDLTIQEGQVAQYECRVEPTTDPDLKVEWFFGDKELQVGSRYQPFSYFGFIGLNILQTTTDDSGIYTCRISNAMGQDECSARLEVISSTEVADGNILAKLQYLEDSSRFRRETEIEEEVKMAPRFLTPFKDLKLPEGQVAHFDGRVEPTTDPDLKVDWFFEGKELQVGSRYQPFSYFGFVGLNIMQITTDDSGVYTCRISNKVGQDECSVRLEVVSVAEPIDGNIIDKFRYLEDASRFRRETQVQEEVKMAPQFLTPFKDLTIQEGQVANFDGRIEPATDPDLKVEWFFGEKELQVGSRYQPFSYFGYIGLNILQTTTEDSGTYICRISNRVGQMECSVRLQVISTTESTDGNLLSSLQSLDSSRLQRESEVEDDVKMAPRFLTPFKDLDLEEGQVAHYDCRIEPTNDPDLKVEWFVGDKELQVGSRYQPSNDFGFVSLNILQLEAEDSGVYTCRLTNSVGQASQSAKLVVTTTSSHYREVIEEVQADNLSEADRLAQRMAPTFVVPPEAVVVDEGDVAKFQCRIIGYPRPRIMWVLNGNTCVNGSRYKLTFDGIYHFEVLRSRIEDEGKVEVFARNIVGEATCVTTLTVRPKRSDYRAVLKNSPRPWYDHDHARYQKERYEAELDKVFEEKLTPGGTEVKVWRTEQTDEGHIKVQETVTPDPSLMETPDFKQYKTDIFYAQKSQAAKSKAEDESNVSWMAKSYQKHIGSPATERRVLPKQQPPVSQPKSAPPQPQQQQQQRQATVQVQQAQGQQVRQGQQVGQQGQQGKVAEGGEKEEHFDVSSMTQKQVQKEYQGDLEVTRKITEKDTIEHGHKKVVQMTVAGQGGSAAKPPSFTVKIQPAVAREGQDALFKCEFVADPAPKITWMKEGQDIPPSARHQVKTTANMSILLIRSTVINDAGVYAVRAENAGGLAKCSANLVVDPASQDGSATKKGAPRFVKTIQSVSGTVGQLLRLDGMVAGAKPMNVHWLRDGEVVEHDMTHKMVEEDDLVTLLFLEAGKDDRGVYECLVMNDQGEARCQATVDIIVPGQTRRKSSTTPSSPPSKGVRPSPPKVVAQAPEVKEGLKNLSVPEGKEVVFQTKITNCLGSEILWFKGPDMIKPSRFFRIGLEGSDLVTLTIAEAFPEDEGVYKCQVTNAGGSTSTSATLKVLASSSSTTSASSPGSRPSLSPLKSVTVTEGSPARFLSSVKGDPRPQVTWYREGVEIKPSRDFQLYQDNQTASLVIKTTYLEDSGLFTLRAANIHGQVESEAALTVTPKK